MPCKFMPDDSRYTLRLHTSLRRSKMTLQSRHHAYVDITIIGLCESRLLDTFLLRPASNDHDPLKYGEVLPAIHFVWHRRD